MKLTLPPWYHSLSLAAICLSASLISLDRAIAQTAVISVSAQTAQGTTQTEVHRITLGTSQGVNLSFLRTGETVERVWLNDPSRVVMSFDGCLASEAVSSGESAGGDPAGCESNGAQIMQLRQLQQPIDFPINDRARNGNEVFLTVITTSSQGRRIYQFQLVLGGLQPPYSLVEILPTTAPAPAQLVSVSQEYQQTVLRQLSAGLAYAESRGLVDPTSTAYQAARSTLALMQQGTPMANAITQANAPRALIDRLRSWGSQSP